MASRSIGQESEIIHCLLISYCIQRKTAIDIY